jgi:hypothetical protein
MEEIRIYDFLKTLPSNSHFYMSRNPSVTLSGSVDGRAIAILVLGPNRRMTKTQINFSSRFIRAGGEYLTIRNLSDITEIAKIKGWFDD